MRPQAGLLSVDSAMGGLHQASQPATIQEELVHQDHQEVDHVVSGSDRSDGRTRPALRQRPRYGRTGALSKSRNRSWPRRPATMQGIGLAMVCAQGPSADRDDAIHETTIEERESTIAPARGSTDS